MSKIKKKPNSREIKFGCSLTVPYENHIQRGEWVLIVCHDKHLPIDLLLRHLEKQGLVEKEVLEKGCWTSMVRYWIGERENNRRG